ncbi:hypothetical protein HDU93_001024 [Gonapodya sp. JEL0774]|nr:hypothetical protein HDU93_001024 [Gonapodya sp. JEL0774]
MASTPGAPDGALAATMMQRLYQTQAGVAAASSILATATSPQRSPGNVNFTPSPNAHSPPNNLHHSPMNSVIAAPKPSRPGAGLRLKFDPKSGLGRIPAARHFQLKNTPLARETPQPQQRQLNGGSSRMGNPNTSGVDPNGLFPVKPSSSPAVPAFSRLISSQQRALPRSHSHPVQSESPDNSRVLRLRSGFSRHTLAASLASTGPLRHNVARFLPAHGGEPVNLNTWERPITWRRVNPAQEKKEREREAKERERTELEKMKAELIVKAETSSIKMETPTPLIKLDPDSKTIQPSSMEVDVPLPSTSAPSKLKLYTPQLTAGDDPADLSISDPSILLARLASLPPPQRLRLIRSFPVRTSDAGSDGSANWEGEQVSGPDSLIPGVTDALPQQHADVALDRLGTQLAPTRPSLPTHFALVPDPGGGAFSVVPVYSSFQFRQQRQVGGVALTAEEAEKAMRKKDKERAKGLVGAKGIRIVDGVAIKDERAPVWGGLLGPQAGSSVKRVDGTPVKMEPKDAEEDEREVQDLLETHLGRRAARAVIARGGANGVSNRFAMARVAGGLGTTNSSVGNAQRGRARVAKDDLLQDAAAEDAEFADATHFSDDEEFGAAGMGDGEEGEFDGSGAIRREIDEHIKAKDRAMGRREEEELFGSGSSGEDGEDDGTKKKDRHYDKHGMRIASALKRDRDRAKESGGARPDDEDGSSDEDEMVYDPARGWMKAYGIGSKKMAMSEDESDDKARRGRPMVAQGGGVDPWSDLGVGRAEMKRREKERRQKEREARQKAKSNAAVNKWTGPISGGGAGGATPMKLDSQVVTSVVGSEEVRGRASSPPPTRPNSPPGPTQHRASSPPRPAAPSGVARPASRATGARAPSRPGSPPRPVAGSVSPPHDARPNSPPYQPASPPGSASPPYTPMSPGHFRSESNGTGNGDDGGTRSGGAEGIPRKKRKADDDEGATGRPKRFAGPDGELENVVVMPDGDGPLTDEDFVLAIQLQPGGRCTTRQLMRALKHRLDKNPGGKQSVMEQVKRLAKPFKTEDGKIFLTLRDGGSAVRAGVPGGADGAGGIAAASDAPDPASLLATLHPTITRLFTSHNPSARAEAASLLTRCAYLALLHPTYRPHLESSVEILARARLPFAALAAFTTVHAAWTPLAPETWNALATGFLVEKLWSSADNVVKMMDARGVAVTEWVRINWALASVYGLVERAKSDGSSSVERGTVKTRPTMSSILTHLHPYLGTPIPISARRILHYALLVLDEMSLARSLLNATAKECREAGGSGLRAETYRSDTHYQSGGLPPPPPELANALLAMSTAHALHLAFPSKTSGRTPSPSSALPILALPASLSIPSSSQHLVASIRVCSALGDLDGAIGFYTATLHPAHLRAHGPPSSYALTAVVAACTAAGRTDLAVKYARLHRMASGGADRASATAIMRAHRAAGQLEQSDEVWRGMVERAEEASSTVISMVDVDGVEGRGDGPWTPDLRAWNEHLAAYAVRGEPDEVQRRLDEMEFRGVVPDAVSYGTFVTAVLRSRTERLSSLPRTSETTAGPSPSSHMDQDSSEALERALAVLPRMAAASIEPNSRLLTTLAVALTRHDTARAVYLIGSWRKEYKWKPDKSFFAVLSERCSWLAEREEKKGGLRGSVGRAKWEELRTVVEGWRREDWAEH